MGLVGDIEEVKDYYYGGYLMKVTQYVDGVLHGEETRYYRAGGKLATITYVNGKPKGWETFYDRGGNISSKRRL